MVDFVRSRLFALAVVALALLAGGLGLDRWQSGETALAAPTSCVYSGGGSPFSMQSFEGDRPRSLFLDTQRLAAGNLLLPEDAEFQLLHLKVGPDRIEDLGATIPPEILYAIAWIESATNQTAIEVPYGRLGPALVSFDCGYGIMQVTSTIVNDGGLPSRYESLVGTHFAYNVAAGARILAEKWNSDLYPIIGANDPRYIESWYYALWAYNGWAGVNHPLNPIYNPQRGIYDCRGGATAYPYQERVLGCIINPPEVDGRRLWDPVPVVLPDLDALATNGGSLDLDVFYAGLDTIHVHVDAVSFSPFAAMNMALPEGATARTPPDVSEAKATRTRLLGSPVLRLNTDEIELTSAELESGAVQISIGNDGTGLLAWRIAEAPSWLSLNISAGVALGDGYDFASGPMPSLLTLSSAAGGVPEGSHQGAITLEIQFPDGRSQTERIAISLDKRGAAFYEAGRPQSCPPVAQPDRATDF